MWDADMEPTGKLIMCLLLDRSVKESAEVPERFAPSFDELAAKTGYSRSTVAEWMKVLAANGWFHRGGGQRSKSGYELTIGNRTVERPKRTPTRKGSKMMASPGPPAGPGDAADTASFGSVDGALFDLDAGASGPPSEADWSATRTRSGPMGGPDSDAHIRKNPPTEGSFTDPSLNPPTAAQPATKPARKSKATEPRRDDVEHVCNALVQWRIQLGCKPPTITEEWRAEARRMIDLDGRSLDDIRKVMEFSQRSAFWRPNVKSIPKFREQFDTLRLQMEGQNEQPRRAGGLGRGDFQVRDTHAKTYKGLNKGATA